MGESKLDTGEELGYLTLKIYVAILESREPLGVRDIARNLNMPVSTVHYHIKKLEELDLIKPVGLGYTVKNPIPLEGYIIVARRMIPKLLIYSLFFLGAFLGELIIIAYRNWFNVDSILALIISFTAFITLFYEGVRLRTKIWK